MLTKPTILPVSVENGQLIVNANINGQGPFPMLFDTGSVEAITPKIATALGLSVEGAGTVRGSGERAVSVALTHLQTLRLGGAELSDIALPVIPLPQFITDRGNRPPLAGLIGFGVLSRFAVRLSYDDQTLTLIPAGDFRYSGRGERVPLFFADKTSCHFRSGRRGLGRLRNRHGVIHRACAPARVCRTTWLGGPPSRRASHKGR